MPTLPPLSMAERSRRWDLARDIMQAEGLRALVVYGDREAAAPAGFSPIATSATTAPDPSWSSSATKRPGSIPSPR